MSLPFLAQIQIVGCTFAPRGWAFCNGQLLSIAQNTALFSLLGTTYGGNGQTTYALPNLQGRVPIGVGQGPGQSNRDLGEVGGAASVTLTPAQMPAHSHALNGGGDATTGEPAATRVLGVADTATYAAAGNTAAMSPATLSASGSGQPHNNRQPYLALNFVIAVQGIFPSRN